MAKLERWRVPAERLTLEVTEKLGLGYRRRHDPRLARGGNPNRARRLSNLKQFPIDRLKIDKSFVRDLHDPAIVSAVLSLGSSMGMKVVAEGVEDNHQLELLDAMGRDQAQGYYFARSTPATEVPTFLSTFGAPITDETQAAA